MDKQVNKMEIEFPKGLPGFENYKAFELAEEEDTPLAYLNSLDNKDVGFVLFKPYAAFGNYLTEIEISSEETEILDVQKSDHVDIWVLLTLCLSDMNQTTANLRAPIIINPRTKKGIQLILDDENYSSRHPVFNNHTSSQTEDNKGCKEGAIG